MKLYDKTRACKKCGESGASTEYVASAQIDRYVIDASIKRKCQNCGYEWREHPLDTQPPVS